MNFQRVQALILRYLYLYPRSVPRILDVFFWPIVELLIWGFLTIYLQQIRYNSSNIITAILGALVFWNFVLRSQQAVSISFMEEMWEKNLLNLFVTPLKLSEFLGATLFVGLVRLVLVGFIVCLVAYLLFAFNIFTFGFYLIPFIINLFLFGWILGLIATSILMRFGQSAQVLAFAITMLIQPFVAVFYPVSVLPAFLRPLALSMPATHVFEGMRTVVMSGTVPVDSLLWATGLNMIWLVIAVYLFYKMFDYILETGQLLRLID